MNKEYDLGVAENKIGDAINKRIENYYSYLNSSGIMGLWRRSHYQYFSAYYDGGEIGIEGVEGEYSTINVNDYRNFIQHIAILITSYDPVWDIEATNTDEKSQIQAILIPGILKYFDEKAGGKEAAFKAAEYLLTYADAYIVDEWDDTVGEPYMTKELPTISFNGEKSVSNVPVFEGDVRKKAKMPVDVVFDVGQRDFDNNRWYIIRDYENKYELAAKHPKVRDQVIAVTNTFDYRFDIDFEANSPMADDTDFIPVWTLYHEQSPAVPFGRKTRVCGSQCEILLEDGVLPYKYMPVSRLTSTYIHRMAFGYQFTYDLLSLQKLKNILYSIVTTNLTMFGVGNILTPSGTKIDVSQITRGLNLIEYQPGLGEPKGVNFSLPQGEHMQMISNITNAMSSQVSIPDTARGANNESGKAIAAMQAQTIQFSSRHQRALVEALKKSACHALDILRVKMPQDRKAKFVGKVPSQYIDSYSKEDLFGDYNILLNVGDPQTQTPAGRRSMADNLLQYGDITKDEYFMINKTGNLDVGTEFQTAENLRLKADQEKLMGGVMPIILWTDNHQKFITMARGLLNLPGLIEDDEFVGLVGEYIQQHVDISLNTDPNKLMAIGSQPIQQLPPLPPQGGMPPPPNGQPPMGDVPPPIEPQGQAPLPGVPPEMSLPNSPIDGAPMSVPTPSGQSSNLK